MNFPADPNAIPTAGEDFDADGQAEIDYGTT